MLSGLAEDELALRAVQAGAQDYLVKGEAPGPVLLRAVRHAIERKQSERRLAALAMSDALTGLPNRALLLERAHTALERMERAAAAGGRCARSACSSSTSTASSSSTTRSATRPATSC